MMRKCFGNRGKQFLVLAGAAGVLLLPQAGTLLAANHLAAEKEQEQLALFMEPGQLVEAATRNPTPISQVAENVTVITAAEIEAMHAHTVAEVLNRVTGLIVDGSHTDFGSRSATFIQGSDYDHVLVLLDGVRWSYVSYDYPETNTIPVQIIQRIEVIKGPASSAWGSSLGGVVNIVTRDTGNSARPKGNVIGSYGEHASSDLRGDLAGQAGQVGYYLYAGHKESDGIRNSRFFDSESFYGKLSLPLPSGMELKGSLGYSQPDYKYFSSLEWDDEWLINDRVLHANLDFAAPLTDSLSLSLAAHYLETDFTDIGQWISTGEPYLRLNYEGRTTTANGRLVWNGASQTLVLGVEGEWRGSTSRDELAPYTAPSLTEDLLALYVNDTIRWDRLTLIPGLRYDHLSVADDILSPSLGLTYQVTADTLLRASAGRGFRKPTPALTEGDPYFNITNPDLEAETIWSYQAGVETTKFSFARLKATVFDHRATDAWQTDPDTWAWVNGGDYERQGIELEALSPAFHNLSLSGGWLYELLKPDQGEDNRLSSVKLLLQYDDQTWRLQLFGNYLWLDDEVGWLTYEPSLDTFLWDLVAGYRFAAPAGIQGEVFVALRNLFDEKHYFQIYHPNAPRWVEAGLRLSF